VPFCQPLWWDIVAPLESGADLTAHELAVFRQRMRGVAAESLALLKAALFVKGATATASASARASASASSGVVPRGSNGEWLDLEMWGRLVGLARQNCLEVEVDNPVCEIVPMLRASCTAHAPAPSFKDSPSRASQRSQKLAGGRGRSREVAQPPPHDVLAEVLAALPMPVPPVEGSALFLQISCVNHSCAPNAQVVYGASHAAVLMATRPIARGEEITIAYADTSAPVHVRRAELFEYGFACDCVKCECELAWKRRLRKRPRAEAR